MHKKWIALMLALLLVVSLCAVSALAEEAGSDDPTETAGETLDGEAASESPEDGEIEGAEESETSSPAGPDPAPATDPETGDLIDTGYVPDAVGSVTFENVERRMRESNLQVLSLQESVDMLESIDYADLQEDLRKQLNQIAKGQWYMVLMGQSGTLAYEQMDQAYEAVREQFDAIKDGDMQEDNTSSMRQLKNLQDQIIMAGETTYVALAAMELQEASLQRQLAAMNRTVEEMELRYQLGQISSLQPSQTKAGQASLASGLATLQMNIRTYKNQLEMLLGADMTGAIQMGAVPTVTEKQIASMDVEADLQAAKEQSYELLAASNTLSDERESFEDNYGGGDSLTSRQAKHTWQAAQYTYNNTVQDYERRFQALYDQVNDYRQIWEASKVSLETQKLSYASSELQYQQGTISHNTLLDAADDLSDAEEAVQSAAIDLFSAYNTYCWAVQHGILN